MEITHSPPTLSDHSYQWKPDNYKKNIINPKCKARAHAQSVLPSATIVGSHASNDLAQGSAVLVGPAWSRDQIFARLIAAMHIFIADISHHRHHQRRCTFFKLFWPVLSNFGYLSAYLRVSYFWCPFYKPIWWTKIDKYHILQNLTFQFQSFQRLLTFHSNGDRLSSKFPYPQFFKKFHLYYEKNPAFSLFFMICSFFIHRARKVFTPQNSPLFSPPQTNDLFVPYSFYPLPLLLHSLLTSWEQSKNTFLNSSFLMQSLAKDVHIRHLFVFFFRPKMGVPSRLSNASRQESDFLWRLNGS